MLAATNQWEELKALVPANSVVDSKSKSICPSKLLPQLLSPIVPCCRPGDVKSRKMRNLQSCQPGKKKSWQACVNVWGGVLLSLGNMASLRGRLLTAGQTKISLFGQMAAAGAPASLCLHVCPLLGHLTALLCFFLFFFNNQFIANLNISKTEATIWHLIIFWDLQHKKPASLDLQTMIAATVGWRYLSPRLGERNHNTGSWKGLLSIDWTNYISFSSVFDFIFTYMDLGVNLHSLTLRSIMPLHIYKPFFNPIWRQLGMFSDKFLLLSWGGGVFLRHLSPEVKDK